MKRFGLVFGSFFLLGVVAFLVMGSPPVKELATAEEFIPGEALVQFKPQITPTEATQLIQKAGVTLQDRIDPQEIYLVTFPASSHEEVLRKLKNMPEVALAEPNGLYETFVLDLVFPAEAWAIPARKATLGEGAPVTVAVIDTAFDLNHPRLAGKFTSGFNFTNNTTNVQSRGRGQDWHGTAVTGRILEGAQGANVRLMPIQVFREKGGTSLATLIKAIHFAVDRGAQVINMSLGGYKKSEFLQKAIDRAIAKGCLVVASSGNHSASRPAYPASCRGVISVAATDNFGRKARFSNYGPTVSISAPGYRVRVLKHGGGTRLANGTSFSAPLITGMLAMLKSAYPHLTAAQCTQILKYRANKFYPWRYKMYGKRYYEWCRQWFYKWDPRTRKWVRNLVYRCIPRLRYRQQLGAGYLALRDCRRWAYEIRSGIFRFPWDIRPKPPQKLKVPKPKPLPVQPPRPAQTPSQPWLVKGKGGSAVHAVNPSGDVFQMPPEEFEEWERQEKAKK